MNQTYILRLGLAVRTFKEDGKWDKLMRLAAEIKELGGVWTLTPANSTLGTPRAYARHTDKRLTRIEIIRCIHGNPDLTQEEITAKLLPDQLDQRAAVAKVYVHLNELRRGGVIERTLVIKDGVAIGTFKTTPLAKAMLDAKPIKSKETPEYVEPVFDWEEPKEDEPDFDLDAIGKS